MTKTTAFLLALIWACSSFAQGFPPICSGTTVFLDNCTSACLVCGIPSPFMVNNGGYTNDPPPGGDCLIMHNNMWFAFMAMEETVTFNGDPSNCDMAGAIQIAVYESCSGSCLFLDYGCDGTQVSVTASGLTIGQVYYVVVDGCSGAICDILFWADPPSAIELPPLTNSAPIQGPASVCTNGTFTYCIDAEPGMSEFVWTVPSGVLVNGLAGPTVVLPSTSNGCAEVTVPNTPGNYQICVKPRNPCHQGNQICKTISVNRIPTTVLPDEIVCQQDAPNYILPWDEYLQPGPGTVTYQHLYTTDSGCDSLVKKTVMVPAVVLTNLPPMGLCPGSCVQYHNENFCVPGAFPVQLTSSLGCDSLVQVNVVAINFPVDILTPDTLDCNTSRVTLHASAQTGGVKVWSTLNGTVLGTGDSIQVTQPGQYILSSERIQFGDTCTLRDTALVRLDTLLPVLQLSADSLGCAASTAALHADAGALPVDYYWTGPGGFQAFTADTSAALAGVYSVVAVNRVNGCTTSASIEVTADYTPPDLSIDAPVTIDCNTPLVPLHAQAPTAVSYAWTGPGGFSSTLPQPSADTAGLYNLTVRDSLGCAANASVTVSEDLVLPQVSAAGDTLDCNAPGGTVTATSASGAVTFQWTGPGGYAAALAQAPVTGPGDYVVTATGANGCIATDTATVAGDYGVPAISLSGGALTCSVNRTFIECQSPDPALQVQWSGPGGFNSMMALDTVTQPGLYIATASAANGCPVTDTLIISTDGSLPEVSIAGAGITCTVDSVWLDASSATPGITFAWTGPGGFAAASEDVRVGDSGPYTLVITNPANGCTAIATFDVDADTAAPDIQADAGTITCADTSAQLQASSGIQGLTWHWTGPAGFDAAAQNTQTTAAGAYTVEALNPANGCTATASVNVTSDVAPPVSDVSGAGTLTCQTTALTLDATADVAVQWHWTTPGGGTSAAASIQATQSGNYTVTATAANCCTAEVVVSIGQDIAAPVLSATGDTLDCLSGQAQLIGQSASGVSSWLWTGPGGFQAAQQNVVATQPGQYLLTATAPNGCQSTATATVAQNNNAPQVNIGGVQTLTCSIPSIALTVAVTPAAPGQWNTGAPGTTLNVTAPGTYSFTATGANGCSQTASVNISQDIQTPQNLQAGPGALDCNHPLIALQGSSNTAGLTWNWSGPGGYQSSAQNPADIDTPGQYTLTVQNPVNGCTASTTTTVTGDFAPPQVTAQADTLTCQTPQQTIQTTALTAVQTFAWTGPGGFSSALEDPVVNAPGLYQLVATAANGCTSSLDVSLIQNIAPPGATATGAALDCNSPAGQLTASSAAQGATWAWTGPNGFQAYVPAPSVNQAGTYTLTVTGPNGCSSTATAQVSADFAPPPAGAQGGTITCATPAVGLSSQSPAGAALAWSGPGGFQSSLPNPQATLAGAYTLTVTGQNGCTATASATVTSDTQAPAFSLAAPELLDCNTTEVTLQATLTTTTPAYTAQWSSTDGHLAGTASGLTTAADQPGTYTLLVTNTQNGCTAALSVTVATDPNVPTLLALSILPVSCFGYNDGLIRVDSVTGGTEPMLFSLDGGDFTPQRVFANLPPGQHTVQLSDASGCLLESGGWVTEPNLLTVTLGPDTLIHLGDPIALPVLGAVSDPGRVAAFQTAPYLLTGDTMLHPLRSFVYRLQVSDENRCTAFDEQLIRVERDRRVYIPNVFKPDQDGQNDLLAVFGGPDVQQVKSFRVYDRWGSLVHQAYGFAPDGTAGGWDGRVNGNPASPAVFVYAAEIEFIDGEVEVFSGDVTVVR